MCKRMIKKYFPSVLFLAMFLISGVSQNAMASQLDKIKEKGILSVAVYKKFAPYSDDDGGIDVDVAKKIAEKLGLKVEIMPFDADESMDDDLRNMVWKGTVLGYGPADMMMHVPTDPVFRNRNDKVNIFSAYFRDDIRIVRNRERIPELENLNVFEKELIGVEGESLGSDILSSIEGGKLRKNVRHYLDINDAFTDLANGDLSAVMALGGQAEAAMGDKPGFAIEKPPLYGLLPPVGWAFGVAVRTQDTELAEAIGQAMAELESEGVMDRVFSDHGVKRVKP
ncbi:MAG: transporter substrate-binding domain-containing protein [Gammaproteobacteria bacterium]|nr:MAG: transporter substrate-binding domain-containing protein [Gammaproteobacteria bacterium]